MAEVTSFRFSTKTEGGTIVSGVGGTGGGASTPSNLAYINVDNSFSVTQTFNASISIQDDVNWFGVANGNGSGITDLNATQIVAGTINNARLSSNVALKDINNNFSEGQTINGQIVVSRSSGTFGVLEASGTSAYMEFKTSTSNIEGYVGTGVGLVSGASSNSIALRAESGGKVYLSNGPTAILEASSSGVSVSGVITGDGSGITDVLAADSNKLAGIDASNYLRLDSTAGIQEINNDLLFSLAPEALKTISGNVELDIIGKVEADGNVISGGNVLASSGYMKTDAPVGNGTGGLAVNGGISSTTAQNFKVGDTHLISTTTYGWKGRVVALEIDGTTYSMMVANDDVAVT